MILVKSSNLSAVGYEPWDRTMEIHFCNDSAYEYYAVPPGIYDGLLASESPGKFHHQQIKGRYRCRRIL